MSEAVWTIGLMTGTALDGVIDAALLHSDGERILELGPYRLHPYDSALRPLLAEAVAAARAWAFEGPEPAIFAEAERALTLAHAEAVETLLAEAGLAREAVAALGFHGQTVLHRAAKPDAPGATRQLGDGALLAGATGIACVFDFRSADVAAGGQGAPLAPIYHQALLRFSGAPTPAAALNLGGVANVTWWDGAERLIAFDVGPANGPINEWMERHGLGAFDADGRLADTGVVHEDRIWAALARDFFRAPYPKSLDRYEFSADLAAGLSPADGAATLTALVAAALDRSLDLFPARPEAVIVCGGGRKNPRMMREIEQRARLRAIPSEEAGWRGDAIEAEAFAFLAARTLRGLPISFPQTTGVAAPLTGGRIVRPR